VGMAMTGGGFSREVLTERRRRPDGSGPDRSPLTGPHQPTRGVRRARPEPVAQIAFIAWRTDGMLRHRRFEGRRDHRGPAEGVRERPGGGSRG
jgi:hypothetical protein